MNNFKTEITIPSLGDIVHANIRLDKALNELSANSIELISMRDLAYARIFDAKEHYGKDNSLLCNDGSYLKEGSLFIPGSDKKRILLSNSLLLSNATLAVKAHSNDTEYFPEDFNYEEYLDKLNPSDYYILDNNDLRPQGIPANRLSEFGSMRWLLKDQVKDYEYMIVAGSFDSEKFTIHLHMNNSDDQYIESQSKPFTNQLADDGIYAYGAFYGDARRIDKPFRVRGLKRESVNDKLTK